MTAAKENLFGLGKAAKRKRSKKRKRKAAILEARAALLRAKANKAAALFPATGAPQKVVQLERVKDIDTGATGTIIKRDVAGSGKIKVKWDGRTKPTLIDADQLAKANPAKRRFVITKANGPFIAKASRRGPDPDHLLEIKSLRTPTSAKCSCGKWSLTTSLPASTTDLQGQQYILKWHDEHKKVMRRAKNPKAGARPAKSPSGSKKNPQQKFSQDTLNYLRTEFEALDGVVVDNYRAELDKVFARTSRPVVKQLAEAKIQWLSPAAKAVLVARRNPEKNPLLASAANVAVVLSGIETLRKMMAKGSKRKPRRATKKNSSSGKSAVTSSPKKNLGLISLVENLQAADFLSKKLASVTRKKKNPTQLVTPALAQRWLDTNPSRDDMVQKRVNELAAEMKAGSYAAKTPILFKDGKLIDGRHRLSAVVKSGVAVSFEVDRVQSVTSRRANPITPALKKIHEDFLGRENSGKAINLYTPPGSPKDVGAMAKLVRITMANGKVQQFTNGSAWLGGYQRGQHRRMVIGLKQPFALPNGLDADKAHDYGEVKKIEYLARKPHLYGSASPEYLFFHPMGEEGGSRPHLVLHNGCLALKGGSYKILREGISD